MCTMEPPRPPPSRRLVARNHHDAVAAIPWGDKRGYDLCLDSSALGREKCAEMIIAALQPCALDPQRCAAAVDRFMASFR